VPDGVCEVWWAQASWEQPWHLGLLDETERSRRDALRRPADRARFTVAAALLRLAVAAHLGTAAASVGVSRACDSCGRPHGRPRVPGTGVHVSLSHSGDRVAVAFTRAGAVGVDVEQITDVDLAILTSTVLAPAEVGTITSAPGFFTHWTRKESVLKATGDGLAVPMTDVVLTSPDACPRLLHYPGRDTLPARMVDLHPGAGYAAALTVLVGNTIAVRELDARSLLVRPVTMDR
jgi:4'-phosphopantetheinyl transferase